MTSRRVYCREQDSPGGAGGCGCGSVDERELCELMCGTAATEQEQITPREGKS